MSSSTHPNHVVKSAVTNLSVSSTSTSSSISPTNLANDSPTQVQSETLVFDTFALFPKLPIELRLAVWAFAAPGPTVIIQKPSQVKGRRFHFDRPVPAVLHACRESREMFLEGGEGDKKKKSGRMGKDGKDGKRDEEVKKYRKRDHPVYKLCFRNQSPKSGGAFISDIDSFWGMQYHAKEGVTKLYIANGYLHPGNYTGVAELLSGDAEKEVKHLVLCEGLSNVLQVRSEDLLRFSNVLPDLMTLTILIPEAELFFGRAGRAYTMGTYMPEIDGELDDSDSAGTRQYRVSDAKLLDKDLDKLKDLYPEKKFPVLKFRWERQFVEVENLNVPSPM
ncbi:uncharacterized protein PAC_02460 [Phialocephala subalpina]|uniref:2EXR domain-containing protein n=1 Tax=Phialocephala subalpina TaxID=576137 RepID=A0A1L7WIH7_9HELO|nr:uncharacterized protein PAC_02460 [Phialocephala subalpina]